MCELCEKRPSSQVHHFFRRWRENIRFDDENIVAVCSECHNVFHTDTERGLRFMIEKLGLACFEALVQRKFMYKKRDDDIDLIMLKKRRLV